jgi:hypothetical protein
MSHLFEVRCQLPVFPGELEFITNEHSWHEHTPFHPSSVIQPSPEDIDMTRSLIQAGEMMQIEVLDHLIIGRYCPSEAGIESLFFGKNAPTAIAVARARGMMLLALAQSGANDGIEVFDKMRLIEVSEIRGF